MSAYPSQIEIEKAERPAGGIAFPDCALNAPLSREVRDQVATYVAIHSMDIANHLCAMRAWALSGKDCGSYWPDLSYEDGMLALMAGIVGNHGLQKYILEIATDAGWVKP